MGEVIDKISTIGQTSNADRARTGARDSAAAAQSAAMAREEELKKAVGFGQTGLDRAQQVGRDLNSPEQLRAFTQALSQQESALAKQAQLFDSLDPAILEASNQALKLLRGEDASALAPLKTERARQRQALLDRLREQLGPGAETSTAGIQALNQFDQETSNVLNGAQQQGISQLFGIGQAGAQGRSALNQGAQSLSGIGAQMAQTRLGAAGLEQGAFANLIGAQSGLASGAGSQFTGQQLMGQFGMQQANQNRNENSQIFGQLFGSALEVGKSALGVPPTPKGAA